MFESDKSNELVNICDVKVNKDMPKQERIINFIKQIKNPYYYKCENINIIAKFPENGKSFEDCLRTLRG